MKNQPFQRRARFALNGIVATFRHEKSFRTQAYFALLALVALLVLRPAAVWWALVGIMIALVLAAELFNTALEQVIDRLHPEQHPRIGLAKDCAAAAVLVLSLASLVVGALMLWSVVGTP